MPKTPKQKEMEKKKRKTTTEQIAELKKRIVNCKDVRQSETLLNQLLGLHKSSFEMNRLLDIPLSDIREEIDFGANKLYRSIKGYIWECKGGMTIFVEHRMTRVCTMLNTLFELNAKKNKTEEEQKLYDSFQNAVSYIMQAPIFSSLNEQSLFQNATAILSTFNEYCTENYTNAEAPERTEKDYMEDAEMEIIAKGVETLAESPLSPED